MKDQNAVQMFIQDYNTLLEEFNEGIEGIEDMTPYKMAKSFKDIDVRNIEDDEDMMEQYYDLKS